VDDEDAAAARVERKKSDESRARRYSHHTLYRYKCVRGRMKDGIRTRDEIGTTVYDCYMPTVNGRPPLSAERHGRRGGVWGSAGGVK